MLLLSNGGTLPAPPQMVQQRSKNWTEEQNFEKSFRNEGVTKSKPFIQSTEKPCN